MPGPLVLDWLFGYRRPVVGQLGKLLGVKLPGGHVSRTLAAATASLDAVRWPTLPRHERMFFTVEQAVEAYLAPQLPPADAPTPAEPALS